MNRKKIIGVLSIAAILGGLMSAGIPVNAKADIQAYTIKIQNDIYKYDKYEVMQDFLNYKRGKTAKLYNEFSDKLKKGNGFYAFQDSEKGYIDYSAIKTAFIKTKHEKKLFNIEKFVQSKESKVIEVSCIKKVVITKDGQVKYETPVNNDIDNKNKDIENKESNKENNNKSTDSKDVVSNDNKSSENNTSSSSKHKHKHKSSSSVKENKEEKKSDLVQKDDKKDQEAKAKEEQLKKDQEEKAKAKEEQLKKDQEAKAKQEQLKKEQEEKKKQEQAEKDKQAKTEDEKKTAEQQKEAEAKAKAEKAKQEQKAKKEAEKIEKEKKDEAERQKAKELKKQEELRKQKEAEAAKEAQEQLNKEQAEKAKQEQLKKEQEEKVKAEQAEKERKAKIEAENNKLIEEAKNNINLGDLNNVKNNLALPNKNANGIQITWESSDQSVIKNDGTITRPSADKGDKKVTLTATFTKDSVTSTKNFEAIVKAEEKILVKTEEEEIAELLKADKKIEVTQPEKFDKVVKEAVKQLKSSFTVMVPYNESGKFNFDNFNNVMVEFGGEDYGKPAISTLGGRFTVVNGKIPMTVQLNYMRDINEVKRQKKETEDAIKTIVAKVIKPGMTDVEKELALHDYVVKHADYNMAGLNKNPVDLEDHSAYGVLVLGKGVCESYAKAMHLLLNEVGIECKYATGYKKYENGAKGGGHAWNMVKLDNEWYNLDATWDDPVSDRVGKSDKEVVVSPVIHTYFNVNDAIFNRDHIRGEFEEKNYPAANGTKYSYDNLDVDEFMNDGTKVPTVASKDELIEKVKEAMKNRETTLYVRLKGFKMTQQELMNELGKVLDGNIYKSYGVSPTDSSHAYCNLVLR